MTLTEVIIKYHKDNGTLVKPNPHGYLFDDDCNIVTTKFKWESVYNTFEIKKLFFDEQLKEILYANF